MSKTVHEILQNVKSFHVFTSLLAFCIELEESALVIVRPDMTKPVNRRIFICVTLCVTCDKSTVVQSRAAVTRSNFTLESRVFAKMPSWFSYWRVQKKFPDLTGPFAVGCTDYMCAKDDSAGVTGEAGSFIRLFYPIEKAVETQNESNKCFWIPRHEYTSGMVDFMKLPAWFFSKLFHWTVGECNDDVTALHLLVFPYVTRRPCWW